jgi:tRNA-binding protein
LTISYDDFAKVDIRVGTIIEVEDYPEARRPAYKLRVDLGPEIGVKRSSAQVTTLYTKEQLLGRQVAAVVNFPPKQIGKFMSEVLVLGFPDAEGRVVLIGPERGGGSWPLPSELMKRLTPKMPAATQIRMR